MIEIVEYWLQRVYGKDSSSNAGIILLKNRNKVYLCGRTGMNDIVCNHAKISKRHCAFSQEDNSLFVEDFASTNGVFVNGVRLVVRKKIPLKEGDIISLSTEEIETQDENEFIYRVHRQVIVDLDGESIKVENPCDVENDSYVPSKVRKMSEHESITAASERMTVKKLESGKLKADKINEEKLKEDKLEADKLEAGKTVQIAPSPVTYEANPNQTSIKMNIELCITGNKDVLPNIFINQSSSNPNVISIAMEPKNATLSSNTMIKQENVIKNESEEIRGISSAGSQLTAAPNVSQSTIPVVPQLASTSTDPRLTNASNFRQVNADSGPDTGSDMPIKQENISDDEIVILNHHIPPSESSVAAESSQMKIIQNQTQNTSFVSPQKTRDNVGFLNLKDYIKAKNLNTSAKSNNVRTHVKLENSRATDKAENPSQEIRPRNTSNISSALRSKNNINSNTIDNANSTIKTENPKNLIRSNSEEQFTIIDLCDDDHVTLENGDLAEMNDQTLPESALETKYNIREPAQSDNPNFETDIEILEVFKKLKKKKNKEKKNKKEKRREKKRKNERKTEKKEKIEEKNKMENGEINLSSELTIGAEDSLKEVERINSEKESKLVDCKDNDSSDKNESTFKKGVRVSDKVKSTKGVRVKSEKKIHPFSQNEERNQTRNSRASSVKPVTNPIETSSHHNFKDLELRSKDPGFSPPSLKISTNRSRAPSLNSNDSSHNLKNPTEGTNQFSEALRVENFQKKNESSEKNHSEIVKQRFYGSESKNTNFKQFQVQGRSAKRELPKYQALCQKIVSWDPLTCTNWFSNPDNLKENELKPTLKSYDSYEEYCNRFLPLVVLDVSREIKKAYKTSKRNASFSACNIVQGSVKKVFISQEFAGMLKFLIKISSSTQTSKFPKLGDLLRIVIMREKIEPPIIIFAYVLCYQPLREPKDPTSQERHLQGLFTVVTKTLDFSLYKSKIFQLQVVLNLFHFMKLAEAMDYLQNSPLMPIIIKPDPKNYQLLCSNRATTLVSKDILDEKELDAVMKITEAAASREPKVVLVEGPPGTGKTQVIVNTILQLLSDEVDKQHKVPMKILVCASTEKAIDEIVLRIYSILQTLEHKTVKMTRLGEVEQMHSKTRKFSLKEISEQYLDKSICNFSEQEIEISQDQMMLKFVEQIQEAKKLIRDTNSLGAALALPVFEKYLDIKTDGRLIRQINTDEYNETLRRVKEVLLSGHNLITCSLLTCYTEIMDAVFGRKNLIPVCIIDEATLVHEVDILQLLSFGVQTLVLIGDADKHSTKYLDTITLNTLGMGESLFSRIKENFSNTKDCPIITLDHEYRMDPEIANFPN